MSQKVHIKSVHVSTPILINIDDNQQPIMSDDPDVIMKYMMDGYRFMKNKKRSTRWDYKDDNGNKHYIGDNDTRKVSELRAAYDFIKSTFGGSVELYDDLLVNAGAIASYLPAAESDVYQEASDFYGGQKVYADIVDFASKVPAFDCGAYYSDVRSALTDVITNVVQNGADVADELQTAQDTVEFNIEG